MSPGGLTLLLAVDNARPPVSADLLTTVIVGLVIVSAVVAGLGLYVGFQLSQQELRAEDKVRCWGEATICQLIPQAENPPEHLWSEDLLRTYLAGLVEIQRSLPPLFRAAQPRARSMAAFLVAGAAMTSAAIFATVLAVRLPTLLEQPAEGPSPAVEEATPAADQTSEADVDEATPQPTAPDGAAQDDDS